MCGIFGEFLFSDVSSDVSICLKRLNLLAHRGPDGYGFEYGDFQDKTYRLHHNATSTDSSQLPLSSFNYFIGHRRLSIIDLSDNAFQPMEDATVRYSITFNGEIYNYIELREELVSAGYSFRTDHSDTEVLLNAYAAWGYGCLEKLRGMFAFAIYDRVDQCVFIARDRMGQKTVYYELSEDKFSFASELDPLLKYTDTRRNVSIEGLSCYLAFGYIPHPVSFYEGIYKLPPATYALVDLKTKEMEMQKYWDLDIEETSDKSTEQFVTEVDRLLTESVTYRLRSDVPIGAFISGGTDSTVIVKKIKEIGNRQFDIFGADFPQVEMSEKQYIEAAAARYSLKLNLSEIDIFQLDAVKGVINVFDEPFDGGSSIALFDLFKVAKQKYKVILTGDGGDEMFAGYSRYTIFLKYMKIISILKKIKLPGIILHILNSLNIMPRKVRTLYNLMKGDFISNYLIFNTHWILPGLLKRAGSVSPKQFKVFDDVRKRIKAFRLSPVKSLQYFEINSILPGRSLYKLDRFSMFYGIEARSPLLDHKLAEHAFTVPDKINIQGGKTKIILKKILEKDFSQEFVHRNKQGFGNPLSYWFKHPKHRDLFALLIDENSLMYKFIDYKKFHSEFPEIKNGYDGSNEKVLWRMIVLAQYMENYKEYIKY
ncbi:MAG: asparagine synthase (glutamine-hydrolyzing) [Nitrospira sp.]|nr:asparagine synthase (glutamine-hydrolyzing) [Nitrospira sp.]